MNYYENGHSSENYLTNDYLIYYNKLNHVEEEFIKNILHLIINYPLVWYNFLENILKNKVMISYNARALIVSLELLTKQLKNSFDFVFKVMVNSGVVLRTIEKKGFLIIYVYSDKISDFFKNSGFWLEYMTHYACLDIGFNASRGVILKTMDSKVQEIDVLVDCKTKLFLIECKDTFNYSEYDLKKLSNIKRKINIENYGIFVCSKISYNLDYDKYDIGLVRYKYNYLEFREELKDLIASYIINF